MMTDPDSYQNYVWAAYGFALLLYGGLILLWRWRYRRGQQQLQRKPHYDDYAA
ncbi:MAG: heme exporter protein CcmD [Magnetococcales bacterium]|nr:heme exporter protein CcmD [Magnetococcales bacterium]